jgi:class 3 adenylate cyclase
VVPQFALALACLELGVNINNPEQFKVSEDMIEIAPPGRSKIMIPVFTRYGETYKTPIGLSFNVPFYGSSDWAESSKAQGIVHRPLAWIWEIEEWRRSLDSNRDRIRRAYDKLKEYSDVVAPYDEKSPDQIQRLLNDSEFKAWLDDARKDPKLYRVPLEAVETLVKGPEQNTEYRRLIARRLQELRETVAGKVVIIGMIATGLSSDSKPTPLHSACPGAVIHGNIYSALMSGVMWTPAAPAWTYLLITVAGLLATWTMVQVMPREGSVRSPGWRSIFHPMDVRLSPWRATALGVSLMLAWALFNGIYLFDRRKIIVPLSPPVIAVLLVWAFGTAAIAAERFRVVHALRGYVDRRLVNFLGRHPERDLFEPKRQELTVCFSDLQGFTTLTQTLGEEMVPLLQSYLSAMVPVIRSRCGVVNKFMGDGIMFFFGAPDPDPDHVPNAIRCTLEMQAALARFNEEMTAKGFPRLTMRCGINTGPAYVGDAGPDEAREYTALGDTTNVAARLESANKDCGTLILVSDAVRNKVASDQYFFRPVGRLKLRNRKGGVMTYELVGRADQVTDSDRAEAEMLQAMIGAYQAEAFGGCIQLLDKMDQAYGITKLRTRYRERCIEYLANGTPEGFEGQIIEQD